MLSKNKIKYIRSLELKKKTQRRTSFFVRQTYLIRRFIRLLPLQVTDCHFQLAENEPLCHGQRNY